LVLCAAPDAVAKPVDCPDGRYLVEVVAERAGLPDGQPIDLSLGTVAVSSVCPPAVARRFGFEAEGRWFGRVDARWPACVSGSPISGIRSRFDRTCTALKGKLLLRGGKRARFQASRVPQCGDGVLQGSEECDPRHGEPCCEDCRVVPGCSGPCQTDADCAAVARCEWNGGCGTTSGECRVGFDPSSCGGPVCGCDGQTYADACAASAARMPFEYYGACGTLCILGDDRLVCAPDKFCDAGGWRCDQKLPGSLGHCVAVPADPATCVPYNPIPICGCDGNVYQNECYRLAARVQWEACEQ
jgi:hypothetical protein